MLASLAPLRQRNFASVWTAGLISLAGDWMLGIALPLTVLQLTGSIAATSGIVIASLVPRLLFGSLAGVFVDRWCRKRVMVVANVLQALALLPLLAVHDTKSVWIAYVVAAVEATLAAFVSPAENALLPLLVREDQLIAANSLNGINNNIARLAGPAAGGLLAAWIGLSGVTLVDAFTYLIAAALTASVPGRFAATRPTSDLARKSRHPVTAFLQELTDGFRTIRNTRVVFVLIVTFAMTSIGEGIMATLMPTFVRDYLHGGTAELGYLMSAQAVGGIAGGLVGGWLGMRFRAVRLIVVSAVVFGLVDLCLFTYPWLTPALWPGLMFFVLAGIPSAVMGASAMTLLQRSLADELRGRVFAAYETAAGLAAILGATLAGALGAKVGALTLLIIQGAGYIVAGLVIGVLLRGFDRTAKSLAESTPPVAETLA